MKYRPEIDGLRALAVVPVILFHGGFAGFEGGFVGVDVFFVISGFLITGIIADDLAAGRFSLLTFYERRARRILPALFLVVAACIPFAWLWFVPRDFLDFSESVFAVATFWSNILFWRESGYFSSAAELKPLLHTWSLAVEEQFYVLFPLLLMGVWRFGQRILIWLIGALLLSSLALAEWGAVYSPAAAFYLLPTRGWELMIGSVAALAIRNGWVRLTRAAEEGLGLAGLGLIAFAIVAFDKSTPFPGLPALVPTIGTLFLLLPVSTPTFAHRLLSLRVLVGVGLLSYSAYLWHQPLFAFARYRSFGEPAEALMIMLSVATFALAYLSWRFVETPFRNKARIGRTGVFRATALCGAVLICIGGAGRVYHGFPDRLNIPASIEASMKRSDRQQECFGIPLVHETEDWTCVMGDPHTKPAFMVFGDSHALSVLPPFDQAARDAGISGEFTGISGCTPFLGIHALRPDQNRYNCHLTNQRVLEHAIKAGIGHVILVARWTYYTDGGYEGTNLMSFIGRTSDAQSTPAESRAAFAEGLAQTIDAYDAAGIRLTLVAQVPQQLSDPLRLYARAYSTSEPENALMKLSVSTETHNDLQAFVTDLFQANGAEILDFTHAICANGICPVGTISKSNYFDDDAGLTFQVRHRVVERKPRLASGIRGIFAGLS